MPDIESEIRKAIGEVYRLNRTPKQIFLGFNTRDNLLMQNPTAYRNNMGDGEFFMGIPIIAEAGSPNHIFIGT